MIIELGRLRTVRLFWRDSLECAVTRARIISLITEYKTLGWVIVNGLVDSDRVLIEPLNPVATSLDPWAIYTEEFGTELQAKHDILIRVQARLRDDPAYMQWATGECNWTPRLTRLAAVNVTVTEIP